jgi:cytochrome c oxidase subunit 2
MEGIIDLHHEILFYLIVIVVFVLWMLITIISTFKSKGSASSGVPYNSITHHVALEWAWTVIPALVLCAIAGPSFALLYAMDELNHPEVTLKVVGHQWY